ncbi:MAG: hypothetical protein ACLRZ7_00795 [Lachnospiraceae bacterium]
MKRKVSREEFVAEMMERQEARKRTQLTEVDLETAVLSYLKNTESIYVIDLQGNSNRPIQEFTLEDLSKDAPKVRFLKDS